MGLADDIINGTYRKKKKDDEEEKKSVNKITSNSSTTKSSLADSIINKTFDEEDYFSKSRRKEKEQKQEEEQEKEQSQKKTETKSNSLPKASELSEDQKKQLAELQKSVSMSPTEQSKQRIEANNPGNKLKQYVSNAQISEEHLKNIQEGNLKKADKFVPSIQYKSSPVTESISNFHEENTAPVVKNLFLGLGKGLMHSAESGVSAIDRTYQDRDKMMDIMTANTNKIRAEKGFEPLPTAKESKKIILGDSYNKNIFGQDVSEQQKKWEDKKKGIDTKIASNIENTDSVVGKKLAELAPSIGNQLPGYLLPGGAGLVYFTGSAKGAYMEDAKARGMSEEDANVYSGIMALGEGFTDMIGAGITKGVGKNIVKGNTKDALKLFGLDIFENAVEEAIMEPISEATATITGGKETADWSNMGKRMLNSGINGGLSAVIMAGTSAGVGKAVQLTNKMNNGEQVSAQEVAEAVKETLESDKVNQEELKEIIKENTNEIIKQEISETQEQGMTQEQQLPVATGENTYSNQLKQTATEEINNSNIPKSEKEMMLDVLNGMDAITDADLSAIRGTIEAIKETQQLDTKGQYKNDQARRQKYVKYKNDTNTYDDSAVNEVLDMMPKNRNGRRTVKQWLQTADGIGKRIANLSNEEIERIAYKSWFDIQPSKSITQYDNVAKKQVGFQKFTSDEWINAINNAVNEARANNQTTINNKQNNISIEPIEKITSLLNEGGYRSQEQVNSLLEDIKENGIKKPIELIKNSKGEIIINDGNHRLAIAKELGLKEVPVIYLDEDIKSIKDIEKYNKELYNEASDTIKGEYNNDTNGTSKRLDSYIQRSGNIGRNNNTDNIGYENARTTRENDTIYNKEQRDNNRPSSDSTRVENSEWEKVDNKNSIKGSFLIDKIQKYLDKTGLSSKMSVDEFVNKVEKFTLENEDNMTAEQQELYDIIKDIQNRNAVKEENVDYGTNNLPKVKEGYTRLYRGLESEYDANYDKRKLDNSNGYESWTDSYELAKAYGDNVYYIDVPTSEIKNSIIDEDSASETYGDRNLIYANDKPVGIKGKSGSEYMLYTDHDNYSSLKYNKVEENGIEINDVLDIKNKYKDVTKYLILTEDENSISIHNMVVKEDLRNQGIGQNILDDIIEYANKKNKTITLTPTTEFNTKSRLQKWYKANGFVENKGRNTNFEISDTMYKLPKANNADAKHSLSVTDNKGRTLTKEQQEHFKDSKVRDENGNLLTVYHGTASDFTIFDETFASEGDYGIGFYFTDNKNVALQSAEISAVEKDISKYMDGTNTGKVMETYLDIKNPSIWHNYQDIHKYKRLAEKEGVSFYDYMRENYDGIIVTKPRYDNEGYGDAKYYIVFSPNQIKSIDNTNPTSNPDILKEEYIQLSIEGFNREPENNLAKNNWTKYQETKKKTNEVLKREGTKVEVVKRKFSKDFVDNGYIDLNGKTINDATDVVDMAQIFRNPKYETFRVIYTKGNTIVGQEAVSSKTPNETKVYSEKSMARGLYKINNRMERLEADGYYLIHNHPTGTAKASNPDIRVTSILDDKVPGFLGHIIINSGTYALIERASNGDYIVENEININNYKADKVDEMLSKEAWANTQIKDRDDILNLAYDLKNNPNYSSLILTDAKMKPRIILDVPNKFLNMSPKQINGYVRNVARQNGANSAFLATQDIDAFNKVNILNTFQDCILYTIDDNGDLIAKKSKTKDDSSNSIFARYNSITLRANEKIEDIYNSIFETNKKRSTYNSAPTADNILATGEYTKRKTMNPTEISNLKLDNANTTPELKDRKYESGNRESSFFSNIVTDAKFLNKDLRQEMSKEDNIRYYKGITNKETLEKAYTKLQKDGQAEVLNWHSKDSKNANAEDVTEGWILLKQYQDKGDYANAVRVAKKMRDIGTTAGQTIQAYNILSRLTPEGMFYYAQSELSEAYNKMVEGKSKKWIEENQSKFDLTPEETQSIMDIMQDVATMEDGYDKKAKIAEVQKIITDKLPPSAGQSIKAWMRISMLFNTKTQVRNVMGNAVVMPVNAGSDIFASALDKLIAKKTGVRTTGTTKLKKYGKGFLKGLYESYNDFRKGINTRNIEGNRFEVSEGKSFKNKGIGKALNGLDSILSFALDAGDRGFYEATFVNSINNQLVLNKTKEVTQDMIDIATTEALQRTWQDNNAYTQSVLTIRNILNGKVGKYKGMKYGLGDVLIPFAKTPANLTKAMVDYSPAGLVKTLVTDARKFKNSLENGQYSPQLQHRLVQNLGKGMAGTVLYAVAYALAKTGIATGESDEDKDVKNFMKNSLGISSYSIKIGDKSFTYDWAQPISAPLSIMTNIVNSENKGVALLEGIVGNLDTAGSVLLEQSFMEALNEVTSDADGPVSGIINQVLELPSRAVPTFSKQIADMVDGTQRTTFEYGRPIKSAVNSIVAKVPGLSKTLPASIDTLGNEIEKYGGNNNVFNVMFNPANTNKGKLNKVGKEIYDVYNETGDKTIFPRTAPYYINNKGKKVVMDAHQRSDFQTTSGKYVQNSMNKLLKDDDYKKLDDEAKAEIINEIVSDSYAKAKYDVLKIDSKEYAKLRETLKNVSSGSYYNYKFKTKDMKKDSEKMDVLINADYTEKEKTSLYEQYIVSSKDEKYPIIKETFTENGLNITKYLKYKNQDFSADRKDDGTVDGKAVYGSAKQKRKDYIESMGITYTQGIILYGLECAPSYNDKKQIVNYIKTLPNKTSKEKLEMLEKFDWVTIYKDGSIKY